MHPHFALIMTGWIALGIVFGALIGTLLLGHPVIGTLLGIVIGSSACAAWLAYRITDR